MAKVRRYLRWFEHVEWDHMMTLTHDVRFAPPVWRILQAREQFLIALKAAARKHGFKFIWALGVSDNGYIHHHVLIRGRAPSRRWMRRLWRKLTHCRQVHIRPAKPGDLWYLLFENAAKVPNIYTDARFEQENMRGLERFHRVNHSRDLAPKPPKKGYKYLGLRSTDEDDPGYQAALTQTRNRHSHPAPTLAAVDTATDITSMMVGERNGPEVSQRAGG